MPIPYFDRTSGDSFPVTEAQQTARKKVGEEIHKLLSKNLEAMGCFVTPAKVAENPTEAQAKRLAKNGRTLMVTGTIPVPALTFDIAEGEKATTKAIVINFNGILAADGAPAEVEAKETPVVKALTWSELKALQRK